MKTEIIYSQAKEIEFLRERLIATEDVRDKLQKELRLLELKNKSLLRQLSKYQPLEEQANGT